MPREFLQDAAGDAKLPLRGLIGIGSRTDRDRLPPAHLLELLPQEPRRMLLDVDPAFEVERIAQLHEFMCIARVTILAAELAAAIRIDHPDEGHACGRAPRQDAAVLK